MDEHDDPQQEVPELRNAFSQTTAEACENYVEEHIRQVQQNNSNHDSPTSSVDMKRASSAPFLSRNDGGGEDMPKILIGVCAMDKKARSKQMRAIIERLIRYGEFEVTLFGDETILHEKIEDWPIVTCLLSWHSDGFPLKKAQAYAALRKPYLVNDVFSQDILLDRRKVYRKLAESGIPCPYHIIVDRDNLAEGETDPSGFVEHEDYVELNGMRIDKPFVEKPASGEDHNVYIYYPHSMGGGVKRLFRKVDNRSADYDPSHPGTVRREGSFIYEEFLTTGGTDVKVYTVGPRYAHAEARKSPVVDGKVQRTPDGKEVRFPVLLSPQEKEISRMVCLAFGQRVCGFDLLRSERGRSYVCDVNGWSFVKNSQKYYDDTAGILRMIILSAVAPHRLLIVPPQSMPLGTSIEGCGGCVSTPEGTRGGGGGGAQSAAAAAAAAAGCGGSGPSPFGVFSGDGSAVNAVSMPNTISYNDMHRPSATAGGGQADDEQIHVDEELRCVLAVIRHGDRTPKQKMKMKITQAPLLALLDKYIDSKGKQAKLKSPNELQELLDVTRQLLEESEAAQRAAVATAPSANSTSSEAAAAAEIDHEADELRERFRIMKTVLEQGGQFAGINRKVQLKPLRWETPLPAADAADGDPPPAPRCVEALLILKHGGVLTHAGRQQAEALGSLFRNIMYPNQGPAGGGLLRLHSTYRHDLKIYSSDEGRVQSSAAAFTKGLLDLEGAALTPILVSLVQKDAGMLDAFGKGASADISAAKQELYAQMTFDAKTNTSTFAEPAYTLGSGNGNGNGDNDVNNSGNTSSMMVSPVMSPEPGTGLSSRGRSGNGNANGTAAAAAAAVAAMCLSKEPTTAGGAGGEQGVKRSSLDLQSNISGNNQNRNHYFGSSSSFAPSRALSSMGSQSLEAVRTAALGVPGSFLPETEDPIPGASNFPGRPHIFPLPSNSLDLLRQLNELCKLVVDELRQKCVDEARSEEKPRSYSALTQDPAEWAAEEGKPCGGEKLLLMFDRWRKLAKAFYSDKKGEFDISKVPDIYDAAKYDSIHNAHLQLEHLQDCYKIAKILAAAVIPNEYGIQQIGKLRIGSMICAQLLGKLLADLASMREESIATAGLRHADDDGRADFVADVTAAVKNTSNKPNGGGGGGGGGGQGGGSAPSTPSAAAGGISTDTKQSDTDTGKITEHQEGPDSTTVTEGDAPAGGEHDGHAGDDDDAVLHRLCPTYAQDINSPLRHVRTRIYFTSESHCHSLVNVLRYCQLGLGVEFQQGLLSEVGQRLLHETSELDYMTHIVFRMFERKKLPLNDPGRFRVEILFSPGAAHDPYGVVPLRRDHVIPIVPRMAIQDGNGGNTVGNSNSTNTVQDQGVGVPLARLEAACKPYAKPFKAGADPYALRSVAVTSQVSEVDYWM
ncbi:hypothetical protein Ndes2526B_g08103 [Nannochloris sp. 'desiccata']|nr:hypothetical protein KSW81_002738 [Chlorella desiccata (nom. nud.)]